MLKYSLLLIAFFSLYLIAPAQRINAGEVSFMLNGEKITLGLRGADLSKTNLTQVMLRGEQKGDTMMVLSLNFSLKKLAIGKEVIADPSFYFTLMQNYQKDNRSIQYSASKDGKNLNIVEKKDGKAENITLKKVSQSVEIKKVELKDGVLTLAGDFSIEYESPQDAPMVRKISITGGKFSAQF
jgi:hypothetical protein